MYRAGIALRLAAYDGNAGGMRGKVPNAATPL
jgi:hypothetical protein